MRISVFGATGMAGIPIVTEALTRGHTVTAWSRRLGRFPARPRLTSGIIDLSAPDTLGPVLIAADAAVLAVRPAPGNELQLAPWTSGFLDAAATTGTRVLIVGGAAPLISPNGSDLLLADDPAYVPDEWRSIAQASVEQLRACRAHTYQNWVYLSPAVVFAPGPATGNYARGTTRLLVDPEGNSRITPEDLALAVIDELEQPGHDQHITVTQVTALDNRRATVAKSRS